MSLVNGYINYIIFENGDLININTGNMIRATLDIDSGYLRYQMKRNDGKLKHVRQHKLLGEYFLKKPIIGDKLIMDHIDGKRDNNKLSNLRWLDYSGNRLNSKISNINTSGWTGITKKKNNRYLAKITIKGRKSEKTFDTLHDAQYWRNDIIESYISQFD